ncbi:MULTISPECIES: hypothetical protein [Amycolatopsis]|uniref:Uncharacterized protein n=1 Tax=Amycolatopsis bullii TaxID=941987 RepID=A0ABQ3JZ24_9PSEU|nr:hypothetical protein [Amycolatopsis bullii]GHF94668.1 hypothetical protein GCM10017567_06430 [Amycolatopsis bullii]
MQPAQPVDDQFQAEGELVFQGYRQGVRDRARGREVRGRQLVDRADTRSRSVSFPAPESWMARVRPGRVCSISRGAIFRCRPSVSNIARATAWPGSRTRACPGTPSSTSRPWPSDRATDDVERLTGKRPVTVEEFVAARKELYLG